MTRSSGNSSKMCGIFSNAWERLLPAGRESKKLGGVSRQMQVKRKTLRMETLEERVLLAVSTTEFDQIRALYPDLGLTANMGDYDVFEVTAANLSVANLKAAITNAGTTGTSTVKPNLIVLRTTASQNTITFAAAGDIISIGINATTYGSVTIVGFGAVPLTINANTRSGVMSITGAATNVNLANLTITNGSTTSGGGINNAGVLNITNCTISGNTATAVAAGAGIYSTGTGSSVTITNSTITGNTASTTGSAGGGIYSTTALTITGSTISNNTTSYYGGGIWVSGTTQINTSIISGNRTTSTAAGYGGGGIYVSAGTTTIVSTEIYGNSSGYYAGGVYAAGGTANITNATIAGNKASVSGGGGGIYRSAGTVNLRNSIVSFNYAGTVTNNIFGTLTQNTNNFVDYNPQFVVAPVFDGSGVLTNLATINLRLTAYSPVINQGDSQYVIAGAKDRSGYDRIYGSTVDMGAYEFQGSPISPLDYTIVTTLTDEFDLSNNNVSLREAIYMANSNAVITFAGGLTGSILLGSRLYLDKGITIDGAGRITLDGQNNTQIFNSIASLSLIGLTLTKGTVTGSGGAVYSTGAMDIKNCTISGNTATTSGGAIYSTNTLTISGSTISGNTATTSGGAIYSTNTLTITGSTISDNTASAINSLGGGIYSTAALTITGSTISNNSATYYGGGIWVGGTTQITGSTISGNRSTATTANYGGGGIYVGAGTTTITGTEIRNNTAVSCGAGILSAGTLIVNNSTISDNTASSASSLGGGIYSTTALTITGSTISNNSAAYYGGGIWVGGTTQITGSTISGNRSTTTSGYGGGIYVSAGTTTIVSTEIYGNTAGYYGGGIYVVAGSTVTITNATIAGNNVSSSSGSGGGIYRAGGTVNLRNSIVSLNYIAGTTSSNITGTIAQDFYNLIGNNPRFVAAPDFNSSGVLTNLATINLQLTTYSSGINLGDPQYVISGAKDRLGNDRIYGSSVDMGAYEFQGAPISPMDYTIVTTLTDEFDLTNNDVSLREAIYMAMSNTPITFATGLTGLILLGSRLYIDKGIKIDGAGRITLDGQNSTQIFNSIASLSLTGLTLTKGNVSGVGGAVYSTGALTIANCTIIGNTATTSGGAIYCTNTLTITGSTISGNTASATTSLGGGIYSTAALTITGSTISNNSAAYYGGGIWVSGTTQINTSTISGNRTTSTVASYGGGGIYISAGTTTIVNTEIYGNTAGYYGGGVYVAGGTATITNATIAGNTVSSTIGNGGGIYQSAGTVNLRNSIVFFNYVGTTSNNTSGTITQNVNNLIGYNPRFVVEPTFNASGVLTNFATIDLRLNAWSPAVNQGDLQYVTGAKDRSGNDRIYGDSVDIGAYELQGSPTPAPLDYSIVTVLNDEFDLTNNNVSLREAIYMAMPNTPITFSGGLTGSILLSSRLYIDRGITINGDNRITLDGQNSTQIFYSIAPLSLIGLTLTKGTAAGTGGAVYSTAALTITNSTITGNTATTSGGAIYSTATLTITNSTISGNTATTSGAGIYSTAALTITNSTISGNTASATTSLGGGIYSTAGLTITGSTISNNTATTSGGGIWGSGTTQIGTSTISGNRTTSTAIDTGGGGIYVSAGTTTIVSTEIYGNTAGYYGGGVYAIATTTIINATIAGNKAIIGGGINQWSGTVYLRNSIVTLNYTNTATNNLSGTITQNVNNNFIGYNPQFVVEPTFNSSGVLTNLASINLRLNAWSPAINQGDLQFVTGAKDRAGNDRIYGGVVDIGAYEFQSAPTPASVDYTIVTTLNDEFDLTNNDVSLREAIYMAMANTPITFASGLTGSILLDSRLYIDRGITIDGAGRITLDGQNKTQIFNSIASLSLTGLTLTKGNVTGTGGAIYSTGTLTIANCTITGNTATTSGGGIYSTAALTITNSTISNNTAANYGGGIWVSGTTQIETSTISGNKTTSTAASYGGGGIYVSAGTTTIVSTEIYGNTAGYYGGGIFVAGGTATITNATIAGNKATIGGGIYQTGTVNLRNSIVTLNYTGTATSNISGTPTQNANLIGYNPRFVAAPLFDNAGMLTNLASIDLRLNAWSPAINQGDSQYVTGAKDRSGNDRIYGTVDIGAYEFQSAPTPAPVDYTIVTTLNDEFDLTNNDISLREAIYMAMANTPITFATGLTGSILLGSRLYVDKGITITGDNRITLDGQNSTQIIYSTVSLSLIGLTLTKGNVTGTGGAIYSTGTLTIANCTITGNTATTSGGGIYSTAALTITNSTITGNTATTSGGGIYSTATLTITNSTITGNTATGFGGGVWSSNTLMITNSVISGNTATTSGGGGIYISAGTGTITNVTIAGNKATSGGGGIYQAGGTVNLRNSIVSLNSSTESDQNFYGTPASNLNNFINYNPHFVSGPIFDKAGMLTNFATLNLQLTAYSPVINKGNSTHIDGVTTDVVGNPRIYGSSVDIGAYEYQGTPITLTLNYTVVTTLTDEFDLSNNAVSLREAIYMATAGTTITFAGELTGSILLDHQLNQLNIDKSITITGDNRITLDGQNKTRIFYSTAILTLNGLTLTKGRGTGTGGAIYSSVALTITNSTISGSTATGSGGGIYCANTLTITGSTISNNTATSGGGIYTTAALTITNSTISGNTATSSSGGGVWSSGITNINASTISGNTATYTSSFGGGIYCSNTLTITNNSTISNNTATSGGGIYTTGTLLTITNSTVGNNIATTFNGGGIYSNAITVTNSTITGNTATASSGGGIYNNSGSVTIESNSTISGNTAASSGGGIYINGTTQITGSTISGNKTTNATSGGGGGIYIYSGTTTIDNSAIRGNTSAYHGGGIYNNSGSLIVRNGSFINNNTAGTTGYGGGIYTGSASSVTLTITNSTINGNTAGYYGGGIYITGTAQNIVMTITNSTINSNTARDGGGIYRSTNGRTALTITGCTINNNTAIAAGGAIYTANSSTYPTLLTIIGSTITGNTATSSGGGIYNNAATISITSSSIIGNTVSSTSSSVNASGGGIYNNAGTLTITNSSISGNTIFSLRMSSYGAGIYSNTGAITVTNCTITGNAVSAAASTSSTGGGIYSNGTVNLRNSIVSLNYAPGSNRNIYGNVTQNANNLIDCDPRFVNGPIFDSTGTLTNRATLDLRLTSSSPVINKGNSLYITEIALDLIGVPRIYGTAVDMGAYEFQANPTPVPLDYTIVTTLDDEFDLTNNYVSLREAIYMATVNTTITFANGLTGSILLNSQLYVDKNITITGAGRITIDGQNKTRIFYSTASLSLIGLTLTKGNVTGTGGAIYSSAALTITNCTITGNIATGNGGGIYSTSTLTIANSVISGNTATSGGGIYVTGGTVTITNATITGNSVSVVGGGIYVNAGTVNLRNSIVSLNYAPGSNQNVYGTLTQNANNFIDYNPKFVVAPIFSSTGTLTNFASLDLQPVSWSPLINQGNSQHVVGTTDLLGNPRVYGGIVDLGAYEFQGTPTVLPLDYTIVTTLNDEFDLTNDYVSLREAIYMASSNATITFAAGLTGSIRLNSQLKIDAAISITGDGRITLDGQNKTRIFYAIAPLSLTGLTLTGGNVIDFGGAIYSTAALTITNSVISGNTSSSGGGIYVNAGTVTIINATIAGNSASSYGGGIYVNAGTVNLRNSIVSLNYATGNNQNVYGTIAQNTNNFIDYDPQFVVSPIFSSTGTLTNRALINLQLTTYSPVINKGNSTYISTEEKDLLGNPRIYGAAVDMGAYEFQGEPTVLTPDYKIVTTLNDEFDLSNNYVSLREAIYMATANTTITFDSGLIGSIRLDSQLNVSIAITINGAGRITLAGQNKTRIFYSTASLSLIGLTLTGGNVIGTGGAVYSSSTLNITNCTITGNTAIGNGGGIYVTGGTVTISNSVISANVATAGGGIYVNSGTITINNVTIAGNSVSGLGGGIYVNGVTVYLRNSIVSFNYSAGYVTGSTPSIYGSLYQNANNVIDTNPRFVVEPVFTGTGTLINSASLNLQLTPWSPVLNTGNASYVVGTTDLLGNPRVYGTVVDLGAYEYQGDPITPTLNYTVVTTLNDEFDLTNNDVSLREAIYMATANTTITFAAGLTGSILLNGQLYVNTAITITGAGLITLDGQNKTRIFYSIAALSLTGLTLTNGNVIGIGGAGYSTASLTITGSTITGNTATASGGAIYSTAALTITGSTISGNTASGSGGGILVSGTTQITNSTISGNKTTNATTGYGGGIYVSAGTTTINNSQIIGNSSATSGGGIYNNSTLTVNNGSIISGNTTGAASYGGGIYNTATLTVTNSTINANTATYYGGGIYNIITGTVTITITGSTISGNTARDGGGLYSTGGTGSTVNITGSTINNNTVLSYGGGIYNYSSTINIARSTINGNTATYTSAVAGGGIYNNVGTITISNSTIAGNAITTSSTTYNASGAGMYNNTGTITISNSTISGNTATASRTSSYGGGIYVAGGTVNLRNSIVSLNYAMENSKNIYGTLAQNANNLIDYNPQFVNGPIFDSAGTLTNFASLNLQPVSWSPAINKGDSPYVVGTTDLLGNLRVYGGIVDLGAYEYQGTPTVLPLDYTIVTTLDDEFDLTNDCVSLREAIYMASSNATITFAAGLTGSIRLNSQLYISVGISIDGAGRITLAGQNKTRIFYSIAPLSLTGLTLTGGNVTDFGGAIYSTAALTITNSIIAGNTAAFGGGIYVTGSVATITNVTIAGNSASSAGGGIYVNAGTVNLRNSIVTLNYATGSNRNIYGNIAQDANNYIDYDPRFVNGPIFDDTGTLTNLETLNLLLTSLSPVINKGDSQYIVGVTKDLLGNPRIYGTAVDMGAYEFQADPEIPPLDYTVVTTLDDEFDLTNEIVSLREAIYMVNNTGSVITFAAGLNGSILLNSQLDIEAGISINGAGRITLDGQNSTRIFYCSASLSLTGLTLTGGNVTGYGGAIYSTAALTIMSCTITGNTAASFGGAIYSTAALTITGSVISGNAASSGGGIYVTGGTVTITNTTIAGNSVSSSGGGMCVNTGTVNLRNSIVALNYATGNNPNIYGIIAQDVNNFIDYNPHFVNGPVFDNTGTLTNFATLDLQLTTYSPAINRGDSQYIIGVTKDLLGNDRIYGSSVDIGAYEFQSDPTVLPPDYTVVTTLNDEFDLSNTQVSLREAIYMATPNTIISFAGGLTGSILLDYQLNVAKNITITGANRITLDGQNKTRIFYSTASLSLIGLTLTKGNVTGTGGSIYSTATLTITDSTITGSTATDSGGAIYSTGTLTITGSTVSGNTAYSSGGAIYSTGTLTITGSTVSGNTASGFGGGIFVTGTTQIENSTISGNRTTNSTASYGGGIYVSAGITTVNNSQITGNTSGSSGGGIYNIATLTVTNSTITGNTIGTASYGGGIYNTGSALTITGSTISGNTANYYGGGIYSSVTGNAVITITGSTISGNTARDGGGLYSTGAGGAVTITDSTINNNIASSYGGGIYNYSGTMTVTNSTINGNTATYTSTVAGGGIYNHVGTLIIVNSAICGNTITTSSVTYNASGAGIYNNIGSLTVTNSTIAGNTATSSRTSSYGGGIYNNTGTVTLYNTIVAKNNAITGTDIYRNGGTITGSNNLIGNGTDSTFTNGINNNLVGTTATPIDPMFVMPSAGDYRIRIDSPAVNKGNNSLALYPTGSAIVCDLSGMLRIILLVDIGAYEYHEPLSTPIITMTDISTSGLSLSWNIILNAAGYLLQYRAVGDSNWITGSGTITSPQTFTGLTAGTQYEFRLQAISGGLTYENSEWAIQTAWTLCNAPTDVTVTTKNAVSIEIAWTPTTGAAYYIVEQSTTGTSDWTTIAMPTSNSVTATGLAFLSIYYYRITAVNPSGSSAVSQTISDKTDDGVIVSVPFTEIAVQECCSVFLQAIDIYGQNLTYWWDLSGTGNGEFIQGSKNFWVNVDTLGFEIGEYTIRLLAKNSNGIESEPVTITLQVVEAPVKIDVVKNTISNEQLVILDVDAHFPGGRIPQSWTISWGDGSENYTGESVTTYIRALHYYQQNENDTVYPITLTIVNSTGGTETYFLGTHVVPGSVAPVESALPVILSDGELFTPMHHEGTEVWGEDLFVADSFVATGVSDSITEPVAGYSVADRFDPAFALVTQTGWDSFTRLSWKETNLLPKNPNSLINASLTDWFEDFATEENAVLESINWQLQGKSESKTFTPFEGELDYFDILFNEELIEYAEF